jgi:hypothetical protein
MYKSSCTWYPCPLGCLAVRRALPTSLALYLGCKSGSPLQDGSTLCEDLVFPALSNLSLALP